MKVYEDNDKTELVAEIQEQRLFSLLAWEGMEYSKETSLLSIPIRPDGSNEIFDILVVASADFGTDFDSIFSDLIELCINMDNEECFLYIYDGVEDDIWGCVELSRVERSVITNRAYSMMEGEG